MVQVQSTYIKRDDIECIRHLACLVLGGRATQWGRMTGTDFSDSELSQLDAARDMIITI